MQLPKAAKGSQRQPKAAKSQDFCSRKQKTVPRGDNSSAVLEVVDSIDLFGYIQDAYNIAQAL
jgi:hypothetical protein